MHHPMKRLEPPPLLSQSAIATIKEYILANKLRAGEALPPETELVRQLGISRNSVREAVKALAALGIVDVRRGSGLYVGQFSFEPLLENLSYGVLFEVDQLADLLEVRRVLEMGMIEAAMAAMTPQQLQELEAVIEEMRVRAKEGESFTEADRAFHRILFASVDNAVLHRLLDIFWLSYRRASEHADLQNINPHRTYRDHADILDAVKAGDVVRAQAMLGQHYHGLTDRLSHARQLNRPETAVL
jgi:DNA-binding FadR family transcriptional regulator